MKRMGAALAALAMLGGCSMFGHGDKKPKTAVLGERIPVLAAESDAEVDPALAATRVVVPAPTVNPGWEQPGGNAAKSMGHLALPATPGVVWKAKIAGSSPMARLAATPVVAGGRIYVTDSEAVVRAFNADTGALVWTTSLRAEKEGNRSLFGGGASFADGVIYSTTGLGDVAALDAATGAIKWKKRPGGPLRGAPTIANGHIYVVSSDNQLIAMKPEDGSTAWTESGTLETAGVFGVAAPAAAQGTVIAGFSSGELNAYRYENGRIVWQDALSRTSISTSVGTLSDIDADPVIDQGRVYAVGQGGRMVALDIITGQRLWELNIAGIATPWIAGDWLFVTTDEAKLMCIARTTGKVRWVAQLPRWKNAKTKDIPISWTAPVLAGGRLIVASSDGRLGNVSLETGALGAVTAVGSPILLRPIVANNTLYILPNDGKLQAWR